MLGNMIARVRKEKKYTKAEIARATNINTGHITHIEKGERNPSHKVLKNICKAMEIPYRPLMYMYDKEITEEQASYRVINHLSYDKVLAVDSIGDFIECPANMPGACLAIKINDNSMEPKLKKGSYAFIEFNTPLNNRDIGLFSYEGQLLIRKFVIRQDGLCLRAENKDIKDIVLSSKDKFCIIGKILGTNLD